MTNPAPPPAAAVEFTPVALRLRHDGWTPDKQREFIDALAESACVSDACRRVGMTRKSAYALKARDDAEGFGAAWDAALAAGVAELSDAAVSRAIHGVAVPHYYKGEVVGEHRRYHEGLTMFILRARDPGRYGGVARRSGGFGAAPRERETVAREGSREHDGDLSAIFDEAFAVLRTDQLRELFTVQAIDGEDAAAQAALDMLEQEARFMQSLETLDPPAETGAACGKDDATQTGAAQPVAQASERPAGDDRRDASSTLSPSDADCGDDAPTSSTSVQATDRSGSAPVSSTSGTAAIMICPRGSQLWLNAGSPVVAHTPPPTLPWRPPHWAQRIN